MVDRQESHEPDEAVYDIRLGCRPPQALRAQCSFGPMRTAGAQTALVGEVREPAQLDNLLEKLFSVGLVVDDIHRVAGPSTAEGDGATYEVRVEGEIGPSLLSYLSWRHHIVPEQTLVRIAAGSADLLHCLRVFAEAGLGIERVHQVSEKPSV